jgi:mono/diheme cytochrome c family protein
MTAVIIFIAAVAVLSLILLVFATRGGMGGSRPIFGARSRGGGRAMAALFVAIFVVFGVALPVVFEAGNRSNANGHVGPVKLTADEKTGRELFHEHCAMCHTLAAASAHGPVGPNLDMLKPSYALVMHTLANGCLPNVPPANAQYCLGYGVMDANIVQGRMAQQIAKFVSSVAGRE